MPETPPEYNRERRTVTSVSVVFIDDEFLTTIGYRRGEDRTTVTLATRKSPPLEMAAAFCQLRLSALDFVDSCGP